MTVRSDHGRIILEGRCRIDDAELLLKALEQSPGGVVDIERAETLHTAIVQVLLAAGRPLRGIAGGGFLARYGVLNHLDESRKGGS